MFKQNWKRYLISSVVSFLTGFLIVFVPQIGDITVDSFKDGSLVGLLFLASRAGVKTLAEVILAFLKEYKK